LFGQRVHAGIKHNATIVDEHDVREQILDFFDLMSCDQDRALFVEIVFQQIAVEVLAEDDVETQRRFVKYQQLCVNRGDDRKVQLRDHALGQFTHFCFRRNLCICQQVLCSFPGKIVVDGLDEVQQLVDTDPTRQNRHVSDKANVLHQFLALAKRVQTQHRKATLAIGQPKYRFQEGRLARAVRTDKARNAPFFYIEADVVNRAHGAIVFGHVACTNQASHSSLPALMIS